MSTKHPSPPSASWRVQRAIALAGLIIGLASFIVATALQWTLQPSGANPSDADVAVQFRSVWVIMGLLAVFGPLLWLAGIPAIIRLAPTRGVTLTTIGGLLTGFGLAVGIGHLASYYGLFDVMASSDLPPSDAARFEAAFGGEVFGNVLLIAFLIAYSLGPIVLTLGLRRARVIGVWVPIAAIVTAAASFLGGPVAGIIQLVTLVLLWVPIILSVRSASSSSAIAAASRESESLARSHAPAKP